MTPSWSIFCSWTIYFCSRTHFVPFPKGPKTTKPLLVQLRSKKIIWNADDKKSKFPSLATRDSTQKKGKIQMKYFSWLIGSLALMTHGSTKITHLWLEWLVIDFIINEFLNRIKPKKMKISDAYQRVQKYIMVYELKYKCYLKAQWSRIQKLQSIILILSGSTMIWRKGSKLPSWNYYSKNIKTIRLLS